MNRSGCPSESCLRSDDPAIGGGPISNRPRNRRGWTFLLIAAGLLLCGEAAGEAAIRAGEKLSSFTVGASTYHEVVVRSVNARTVVITHSGGMTSIRLRDLAPEWQARFGYTAEAEAAAEARAKASTAPTPPAPARSGRSKAATEPPLKPTRAFEQVFRQFGRPAPLRTDVDFRPRYFQLELGVKSQGRRPSCAVFAVVSALEYQNAQITGQPDKLSEEYLIWATRRTLQRLGADTPAATTGSATNDDIDEGFSLLEVVAALRGYGIPRHATMPNTFGRAMAAIDDPPDSIIEEARQHQRVFIHLLPGRDPATRINNLVHVLNAGLPVPVGMAWPNFRSLHGGYLSQQQPMENRGHAVTLVGYQAPTERIEDVLFVFKNSWGVSWGQGGYGTVTYGYLLRNLQSAVLLEVQRE